MFQRQSNSIKSWAAFLTIMVSIQWNAACLPVRFQCLSYIFHFANLRPNINSIITTLWMTCENWKHKWVVPITKHQKIKSLREKNCFSFLQRSVVCTIFYLRIKAFVLRVNIALQGVAAQVLSWIQKTIRLMGNVSL